MCEGFIGGGWGGGRKREYIGMKRGVCLHRRHFVGSDFLV